MHPYLHALRRDDGAWRLSDDTEWVESVSRTAIAGSGVLLYGEPGAGQDEFAWRIAHRIAARPGLLEVACPPDAATSASLAAVAEAPPEPGFVLLITDVDRFTGPELDTVVRLVFRHGAVVVAIAADPHGAPEAPLMQVLRLERIRVRGLSAEAGIRFLEKGLDGPLSERAAYAVWDSGAGNRAMVRMIADDWREMAYLVREAGVWVVRGNHPPAGHRLSLYWQQWLTEQKPDLRDVFELLALAGELPLNVVLQVCGPEAVDAVHDLGYLRLRESAGREVSLRGMIHAQAIAEQVAPGRSRSLLDRVTAYVDDHGIRRPAGLVPWRLRCGLAVKPERYIEGAEHLLMAASPAEALDLLRRVPSDVELERVHSVRVGALLAAGQFVDLWTQVGTLRLAAEEARGGRGGSPVAQGAHVSPEASAEGSDGRMAPAAELLAASWRGDFQPILRAAEGQPLLADSVAWLWHQTTHEALVLTGSVQTGLRADRELLHVLEQSGTAPFLVQRGRLGLFDMESLAGEWTRAAATLAGGWNAQSGAPGQGRTGALYNAIAHVLSGQFAACTDILHREVPQLRAVGRHDLLPLAHSLQAVAFARLGLRSEALTALAAVELQHLMEVGIWRLAWAASFFSGQAMGYLGRVDTAIDQLLDFAARDRELGNFSQELLTLSGAVQWGDDAALDLLASAAERVDGRFAEACTWVVRGLRNADPRDLEYGVLLARTVGQHFFADFAQERLEALNGPCPNATDQAESPRREERHEAPEQGLREVLQTLTPRQRDIVHQVLADRSNGEIAQEIGLSIRTIESHLYQAYAKLNVTSRGELRSVLARLPLLP